MYVRGVDFASFYATIFCIRCWNSSDSMLILFIIISYKIVATLEKNEREINYGLYRGTDNIRHKTQNEDKQNRKHNTENYTDEQHAHQNRRWMQMPANGKLLLFIRKHPPCYSNIQISLMTKICTITLITCIKHYIHFSINSIFIIIPCASYKTMK